MTLKTHTIEKKNPKHKQVWEWEETPEVTAAVARLHETIRQLEAQAPDYGVGK